MPPDPEAVKLIPAELNAVIYTGIYEPMNAYRTKTFKSGNSEAVRLPKELGFGIDVEVEIVGHGDEVTIRRKPKKTMKELVAALREMPKPSRPMKRERIVFPKRKGL